MSVYTNIELQELEFLLKHYSLGALISYQGIGAGIENTNYFVTTENGEFVLTIFEDLGFETLSCYLNLMAHLSDHGMPTARPVADLRGDYVRVLKDKPVAIVRRLDGKNVFKPTATHCTAVGHTLAQMHVVGGSFKEVLASTILYSAFSMISAYSLFLCILESLSAKNISAILAHVSA